MSSLPDQAMRDRAQTLIEALPYIQTFAGRPMVIKYGGHAMVEDSLKEDFVRDVMLLASVGIKPIVVHGGGPQIGRVMDRMGLKPTFVDGHRITDDVTMAVVEMVLAGRINKSIVGRINHLGGSAVGLSGRDGGLLRCRKLTLSRNDPRTGSPEIIDPGHVGEVVEVHTEVLETLQSKSFIPVIAPVGVAPDGEAFNVNADQAAGAVAAALGASKLFLLTDVEGVLDESGQLRSSLTVQEARRMIDSGIATDGMIPKLNSCIRAIEGGVEKAHVVDGRVSHAVLLEIFTDTGVGTEVISDDLPD